MPDYRNNEILVMMIIFRTFPACDFPPDTRCGPGMLEVRRHAELQVPSLAGSGGGQSPRGPAEESAPAAKDSATGHRDADGGSLVSEWHQCRRHGVAMSSFSCSRPGDWHGGGAGAHAEAVRG